MFLPINEHIFLSFRRAAAERYTCSPRFEAPKPRAVAS